MDFRDLIPFGTGGRRDVAGRGGGDNPMEAFQREMNRLFDDFFRGFGAAGAPAARYGAGAFGVAVPRVDVGETATEYEVAAELPGLEEKDVEVLLDENMLTLKGEKRAEREQKEKDYHLTERSFGSFRRTIPLPVEIDRDKVEASFKNGVLTVKLPKAQQAQAQAKRIQVKSG